ncbi:replication initiation protein [Sebaldella sp. S0638]|uniref:replication initiation protein n=1 Tax=Sebaldella sp. S0638 TaxID=2957809 RepID=UPI0020A03380|nr:replication initiation protein [Sebaldella sp. S0638]MCP1223922.1 replication initiation protein [Sebaldella sp. S0638]
MEKNMKKNEFFFQEHDIFIDFQKKLNKKDKIFLEFLIKKITSDNDPKIVLGQKVLLNLLNLANKHELDDFLNKFFEKRVNYQCNKLNIPDIEGIINPLSSYKFSENNYAFSISSDFFNIFQKNKKDFRAYNFDILLQFSNPITKKLFLFLTNNTGINDFLEVSLDTLKNYLDLNNTSYSRFYDFEKNILTVCINEIEKYTTLKIQYRKIKLHNTSSSKIIGLKFYLADENKNALEKNTDTLMEGIKPLIKNNSKIRNFITLSLANRGYNYMKKNIDYAKLHYKGNFEIFLIEAVKYDYFENRFSKMIIPFKEKYKLLFSLKKSFHSLPELYENLFEIISGTNLFHLTQMAPIFREAYDLMESGYINQKEQPKIAPFYKELLNLKSFNEFKYEDEKFIIFIEYNKNYDSFIYIFEK